MEDHPLGSSSTAEQYKPAQTLAGSSSTAEDYKPSDTSSGPPSGARRP
ncbi:MAG: hypothetical protein M3P85_14275 [Actinomycetota bacterium]|nr:hypothetical protein [Actinomycetota bacterium]